MLTEVPPVGLSVIGFKRRVPFKPTVQTSLAGPPTLLPEDWELDARAASPVARCQPCEAGRWQSVQTDLESDIAPAMGRRDFPPRTAAPTGHWRPEAAQGWRYYGGRKALLDPGRRFR